MGGYWLLTSARTASNLLVKTLNLEEQNVRPAHDGGYFFLGAAIARLTLQPNPIKDWTEEERQRTAQAHQESFDKLQDYMESAEKEGQVIFVKEHVIMMNDHIHESEFAHGKGAGEGVAPTGLKVRGIKSHERSALNKTILPDEFLNQWKPTFLIRHPAMVLPSLFRTCDLKVGEFQRPNQEPLPFERTMYFNRAMYDYYAAQFGEDSQWPIVLDADDVIAHTEELVPRYAALVGLDPAKVRFSWNKASEEEWSKRSTAEKVMLSSISKSSAVDQSKLAGNIDLEKEAAKWRVEFGDERGERLKGWVMEVLPDYEYMRSKRLMPAATSKQAGQNGHTNGHTNGTSQA